MEFWTVLLWRTWNVVSHLWLGRSHDSGLQAQCSSRGKFRCTTATEATFGVAVNRFYSTFLSWLVGPILQRFKVTHRWWYHVLVTGTSFCPPTNQFCLCTHLWNHSNWRPSIAITHELCDLLQCSLTRILYQKWFGFGLIRIIASASQIFVLAPRGP